MQLKEIKPHRIAANAIGRNIFASVKVAGKSTETTAFALFDSLFPRQSAENRLCFPTGCMIRMRARDVEAETSPCGGPSGSWLSLDLTDVEWAQVAALIPPRQRGARKRSVDVRKALNGIFYMLAGVANGRRRR